MNIRQARITDAAPLLEIYSPVVEDTATSFEMVPPTVAAFADRIATSIGSHEWLVMEASNTLCGYAYATAHRAREAYRHSVETSVYIHPEHQGKGIGKKLYEALFLALQSKDFHNAYAGITLPNAASVALHQAMGFESIGVFGEVGYKFGAWHDVSWWQRKI